MADQNKSGRGPMNSAGGDDGMDFETLGRKARRVTAQQKRDILRASEARNAISSYQEGLESGLPESIANRVIPAMASEQKLLNRLEPRIDMRQQSQVERVSELTRNQIEQAYSSRAINGQSMSASRSSAGQNMGFGMSGDSYEKLESRKASAQGMINSLGKRALNISEGMYGDNGDVDPRKVDQLRMLEQRKSFYTNLVGGTEAAMRMQKSMGADPFSRDTNLLKTGGQAQNMIEASKIAQDVRAGSIQINRGGQQQEVSRGDIGKELMAEATNLTNALKELRNETDTSSKSFKDLKDKAKQSAENFDKLQKAQAAASSGGGGATGAQWASAIGGGFQAVAGGIQQIGVQQRLQQTANISGYAGIENQKYDMYKSASSGDIQSQLMLGQWGKAANFGRSIKTAQQLAVGAQVAGGVAQTTAGVAQFSEGLAEKAALPSYALGTAPLATQGMLNGGMNAAMGATQTAVSTMDLARGTSSNSVAIQGTQAQMEARKALTYVQAQQMQGFRDFGVGASVVAQGMGSKGAAFVNQSVSNENMGAMVNARISPEQFNAASAAGVAQMGSMFDKSQVFAARGMERSGYGNMQENMSRMATLAQAGSNNPTSGLGSVLEAAVSKGLDSSKAMTAMVDHTASMAASSVGRAMGIDNTASAATMLAANVSPNATNKEAALERAASLQERIKDIGTNTDVSFAGMVATARISKTTGLSGTQAISAQKIDTETLKSMAGMTDQQRHEAFMQRGINVSGDKTGKMVDQLLDDRAQTLVEGKGIGFALGGDKSAIVNKAKKGATYASLTDKEKLALGEQAGVGNNFATGEEVYNSVSSVYAKNPPNVTGKGAAAAAGQGGSEQQKMLDDMRTQGFKQLSQAALSATKGFADAAEALKALGDLAKQVEGIGDQGGEAKFAGAAADAAGSFGKSVGDFGDQVKAFGSAVEALNVKSGLNNDDTKKQNRELNKMNHKDKTKSGSGGRPQ